MKQETLALALGVLFALPANSGENTERAIDVVEDLAGHALNKRKTDFPDWLKRTDISIDVQENQKPAWSIETIQPLNQTDWNTLFWQGRIAHSNSDNTYNLGIGYRHLIRDKTWLFGTNAFFDLTGEHSHQRLGVGAEALGQYASFRANYYNAISGTKTTAISSGIATTEQALDGYDLELEAPLPYLPWARFLLKGFRWDRTTTSNVDGYTAGLRMHPFSRLDIELGATDDNYTSTEWFLKMSWHFGQPKHVEYTATDTPISETPFVARDLTRHTLDKVRRHNDIVLERKTNGGGGIVVGRRN